MLVKKIPRIVLGLFLYAAGLVCSINSNLGMAPWEVLHNGISNLTGVTMGRISICTAFVIILVNIVISEKIGFSTVLNMLLIGSFIDILMINHLIPVFDTPFLQYTLLFVGMILVNIAIYLYIGAGYGSGPRDGLMIGLAKRTNQPVKIVRSVLELTVVVAGILLGGKFGMGTVIMALISGPLMNITFKIIKFDLKAVEHQYLFIGQKALKE